MIPTEIINELQPRISAAGHSWKLQAVPPDEISYITKQIGKHVFRVYDEPTVAEFTVTAASQKLQNDYEAQMEYNLKIAAKKLVEDYPQAFETIREAAQFLIGGKTEYAREIYRKALEVAPEIMLEVNSLFVELRETVQELKAQAQTLDDYALLFFLGSRIVGDTILDFDFLGMISPKMRIELQNFCNSEIAKPEQPVEPETGEPKPEDKTSEGNDKTLLPSEKRFIGKSTKLEQK